MLDRELLQTARSRRRGRPSLALCTAAAVVTVALVVALFAAMALASGSATTSTVVGAATNAKFGSERIVVDAHGRTLYALSPETTHHLLCKSNECLHAWPPLAVHSRKGKLTAGPGVHGRLGILRRSNGTFQVTLGGLPVYHFSGDSAKGAANGEGIKSFGGTWHVISAATDAPLEPAITETTPSSPSTPTTSTPGATPTPATSTPTTPTTTTPTTSTPTTTTPPSEKYGY
jgi:predicted lipoprotein with Yx(FWY)xxD motif